MSFANSVAGRAGAVLLLAATVGAGPVLAAPPPDKAAVVQAISDCRAIKEDAARLACYDKAAGAFEQAQSKGDVVVVTREHVQQVRRQAFGFSLPSLDVFGAFGGPKKGEGFDRLTLEIREAHPGRDGHWVFQGAEGVTWRQTDDQEFFKDPKPGARMVITHGAIGSFFCEVQGLGTFRCARVN